MMIIWS